uniref:Uncharacterized protein n=1 Tax=Rhizophora mucronata TaxID=61149 RepID=A0A2P2NWI4_RHIMU
MQSINLILRKFELVCPIASMSKNWVQLRSLELKTKQERINNLNCWIGQEFSIQNSSNMADYFPKRILRLRFSIS